jgi:GINS complex subunit 4
MNERHAPDILPVQQDLLSGLLDHIRRQVTSAFSC